MEIFKAMDLVKIIEVILIEVSIQEEELIILEIKILIEAVEECFNHSRMTQDNKHMLKMIILKANLKIINHKKV
jgi:hypothetical protein